MSESANSTDLENAPQKPSTGAPDGETTPTTSSNLEGSDEKPSTSAPDSTPRGLNDSGLRFQVGDDVPSWAVGKSAKEILAITSDLYGALQRGETFASAPSPTPQSSPPVTPTPSNDPFENVDPNLIYSNPSEYHRQMAQAAREAARREVQGAAPTVYGPQESTARELARNHRPDIWKRYGPEIETTMARIQDPSLRGNVETWKRAVNIVASEHLDDLVEEKARELASRGVDSGTLPSAGGPPHASPTRALDAISKLFAEDHPAIRGHKQDGLDAQAVLSHAISRKYTPDAYASMLVERHARKTAR